MSIIRNAFVKFFFEEEICEQKRELEKIIEERTKGAILRSKTKWYNEGEKKTKYFLSLEKRHYKQNAISQIKISENEFVTSNEDIGNECASFFKNLYESKCTADNLLDRSAFFDDENDTVLKSQCYQRSDKRRQVSKNGFRLYSYHR